MVVNTKTGQERRTKGRPKTGQEWSNGFETKTQFWNGHKHTKKGSLPMKLSAKKLGSQTLLWRKPDILGWGYIKIYMLTNILENIVGNNTHIMGRYNFIFV